VRDWADLIRKKAGKQAGDVCVNDRDLIPKREARDCVCRIAADAGKLLKLSNVTRELALETVCDGSGQMLQSQDAIVISYALPRSYDI
jgi:hypothetical protein